LVWPALSFQKTGSQSENGKTIVSVQELIDQIAAAELDREAAQKRLRQAKKAMMDAETDLIEAKLRKEKLTEKLREFRMQDPVFVPEARDKEIADFCARFPELCTEKKDE
jgi:hypothetical protein